MKIVFTLCSNNYLAHAKTLGDSLTRHNPDYTFVIGLVDRKTIDVDYRSFDRFSVIPIEEIGLPSFEELWHKYDIVELNTCVKASFFKYLQRQHPDASLIFYFDPDIMVFNSLAGLENEFRDADILLTPHILSPVALTDKAPEESVFLNYGLYNLGFLGVKNESKPVRQFLDWWEERTIKYGYIDLCNGFFVDQLWINLVPILFEKVKLLRSTGYNAAPWNLHERCIRLGNENFFMEDGSRLSFFHFSAYNYEIPDVLSRHYDLDPVKHPDLKALYQDYLNLLIENRIQELSKIPCYYVEERNRYLYKKQQEKAFAKVKRVTKNIIKEVTPPLVIRISKAIYRVSK